jgi:predicted nuclease with TOPRIM domain
METHKIMLARVNIQSVFTQFMFYFKMSKDENKRTQIQEMMDNMAQVKETLCQIEIENASLQRANSQLYTKYLDLTSTVVQLKEKNEELINLL